MASNKTLTPTNVTISIPAMTDSPNASVFSNCVDKEADAINALNTVTIGTNGRITYSKVGRLVLLDVYAPSSAEEIPVNQWTTIGTLPVGYRPPGNVNFLCSDNNVSASTVQYTAMAARIYTDGSVAVWSYKANSVPVGSAMFIV